MTGVRKKVAKRPVKATPKATKAVKSVKEVAKSAKKVTKVAAKAAAPTRKAPRRRPQTVAALLARMAELGEVHTITLRVQGDPKVPFGDQLRKVYWVEPPVEPPV